MGCKNSLCSAQDPKKLLRSRLSFQSHIFLPTDLDYYDNFFESIQSRSDSLTQKLKLLQFEKSLLYHSLEIPSLFNNANSSTACICLVLFLVASGNQIEFSDSCPYLQVSVETDLFLNYKKYIELLHQNIVALTELKPELQDCIEKAKDFLRKISTVADEEGLDLDQKLNLVATVVQNCKVLWQIPISVEHRLCSVKKDLFDVKNGIKTCIRMSSRFSLFHGKFVGSAPDEVIRRVWDCPGELNLANG